MSPIGSWPLLPGVNLLVKDRRKSDDFVISRKALLLVIPAQAGIQAIQVVTGELYSGFHRSDDFLRIHQE